MKRLRIVSAVVHLNVVIDDGETLTPVNSQPVEVIPADLDTIGERIRNDLAAAEAQINDTP